MYKRQRVYDELEMLQYKVSDSRSRKEYIAYLESPRIQFENHYVHRLAVFDDELYSLFVEKLGGNDNYKRLHLIDSLNVYLTELIRQPSTEEVFKTMNNLERLDKWIDNQYVCESDGLRKYTYKTAAEKLRRGMYYAGQHRGYSPGLCHDTLHNHLLRLVIILCPIAVTAKDY